MKKGKVLTKSHLTVAVMLVALGAAIWLNSKYLPSSTKYLGEASYVANNSEPESVQTSAKVEQDYFATAKSDRKKTREEAIELIEETLKNDKLTEADKKSALSKIEKISDNMEKENNIENLLKSKGFEKALVIISDSDISIVISSDGLTTANTLQIQDIVTAQTNIDLAKIKIIPIK
jgi:stage III sporulation protein AH